MEQQLPSIQPQCATCSKPAANSCAGCRDAPIVAEAGEASSIYYCSRECQVADYHNHKSICRLFRARKTLFRAGDILQEMFYKFREMMFDKSVAKIQRGKMKGERWVIVHEGEYGKIVTPLDCLVPFPAALCESEEERHALLSMMACSDASAWMGQAVKYLLKDICSKIEESTMLMKDNVNLRMVVLATDGSYMGPIFEHCVFLVTLKQGGEQYALDLSGAQYGLHTPVSPWNTYFTTHIQQLYFYDAFSGDDYAPLGTSRKTIEGSLGSFDTPSVSKMLIGINRTVSTTLVQGLDALEVKGQMNAHDSLKLSAKEWVEKREVILKVVQEHLEAGMTAIREAHEG